jgi:hypothetical protein
MHVRVTKRVLDEGRIFAEPGDVGDVLDSERCEDGVVALTVLFPGAPSATTCILGLDVEALLAVAAPDLETATHAPLVRERPQLRVRRSLGAIAAAAGVAALALWAPWRTSGEPAVAEPSDMATVYLTDSERLPERDEDVPKDWMRAPCPRDPSIRTHAGACFAVLAGKPPCTVGVELKGECVLPVNKGQRFPSSIAR